MRARRFYAIRFLAAITLAIATLLSAQTQRAIADAGQAFSISPPLISLSANPGQTVATTIKFTNISSGDLLIKTQYNDFGAKNETGEPNILFDDNPNATYSLRQWISGPDPFILKSKETKVLNFSIAVPNNAEPGGHSAVLRFTGTAPELEGSGVSLSASLGSLVLLTVSGNIKAQASIASFYTTDNVFAKTNFFETGPVNFVTRIQNTGNIHIEPTGTITLTNMFGRVAGSIRVNGDLSNSANLPRNVLPASIRRFDTAYPQTWLFGRYEAKLNLSYAGQNLVATTEFWVIPYKLIAIVLVGGVALFFGLRWAIKRYNAAIIRKAQAAVNGSGQPKSSASDNKKR